MVTSSASAAPRASGPVPKEKQISRDHPHSPDASEPADIRSDQGGPQRGQQPLWRCLARQAERAPDVLMMDDPLDQPDPAAQRRVQHWGRG